MAFVPTDDSVEIRNVWSSNLKSEFDSIGEIIDSHRYIGLDTEYPGVVIKPPGEFPFPTHVNFKNMIENVNATKIIQLGLTFMNNDGFPPMFEGKYRIWQFNFREFDIEKDRHDQNSIDLLQKYDIDLIKNRKDGVDAAEFSELLMASGAVMRDLANHECCKWLTFQGGYDFGFLLKMLRGAELEDDFGKFFDLMATFFPELYDVKYVMRVRLNRSWGGLKEMGKELGINRVGKAHQAGSDSLLTACVFMELKRRHIDPVEDAQRYVGVLHGINPREYDQLRL